jgi:diguanylate cyclase (GGDEF)-like protein
MASTDYTSKSDTLTIPRPTKRVIAPILVLFFCFCAICVYALLHARAAAYERAADVAHGLVIAIEADISRTLETVDLSLRGAAEALALPEFDRFDPMVRNLILFDRSTAARHLGKIVVLDGNGIVRLDSKDLAPPPLNLADRDYFQVHKNNPDVGLYISRPAISRFSNFSLVGLSRRLSHQDGSFSGVVVASLRTSYFEELFKRINLGAEGNITLSRSDGVLLARWPTMIDSAGLDLRRAALYEQLAQARTGRFETASVTDGVQRLYVYSQIGDLPLIVSIGQSTAGIYQQWNEYAFGIAFMIGVLCTCAYLLVSYLTHDLNRRRAAETQLSILAATDALTGLSNRRHFNEILGLEWQRATRDQTPLALLMIDADNFKAYNDIHGHPAGDHMLRTLGAAFSGVLNRGGDTGARYGGDEFAILLSATSLDGAKRVAEKIRASFAEHCKRERITALGLSIGVASVTPAKGMRASELIQHADRALYRAKRLGRNRTETAKLPALQAKVMRPGRTKAA